MPGDRKRARSPVSTTVAPSSTPVEPVISQADLRRLNGLGNPATRVVTLNELLKLTASYDIACTVGAEVVQKLAEISITECLNFHQFRDADLSNDLPVFRAAGVWSTPSNQATTAWREHCLRQKEQNQPHRQMVAVVVAIFRNLSYVAANIRLLVYTPSVLHLLVGSLYYHDASDAVVKSALQALVNLSPHWDVSGQKLVCDRLFYQQQRPNEGPAVPFSSGTVVGGQHWGLRGLLLAKRADTKEDSVDVSREFLLALAGEQLVAVWSIFPALTHLLTSPTTPRAVLLVTMELLQEAINSARVGVVGSVQLEGPDDEIPSIRAVLASMPTDVLEKLTDCLFVPRTGPDALDYVNPVHQVVTDRISSASAYSANSSYDATVDTDVRDRALEILVPLLELDSPRMAARVGSMPGLWDAVVPILTTKTGRNEASMLSSQLLRELSQAPENEHHLTYLRGRLVELASRNMRVSQLVWNHLYKTDEAVD